jgi:hypothetical protein
MDRIASTLELIPELETLLKTAKTANPSRVVLAKTLRDLADRLEAPTKTASEAVVNDLVRTLGVVQESIQLVEQNAQKLFTVTRGLEPGDEIDKRKARDVTQRLWFRAKGFAQEIEEYLQSLLPGN